ncbi:uncharacterized protein GGS22DRAFT_164530 [Annulohypoxylon maeteangense]|uniref:uncharacterized protein n=1 Tax=Annulohypoxylon maeteangense TaxID=1927788 RepID=UPI002007EBA6|nr:uncharacterized protein GGS22DRAFT_164530 [Annulohypoxylon maeteangense]KAI0884868.1 hypothetical protein GGS22DRAFT_164530 [Annulohypoxylon maeteangense]
MTMPSSVSAVQTKYVFDNDEDGTVPSYLPTAIDKSDKKGTFESEVSTVVDIEPYAFSSDALAVPVGSRGPSPGPPLKPFEARHSGLGGWFISTWQKNKAPLLVFSAQFFGALMNLTARLLEVDEKPMHPIQLLFVRQVMTTIFSSIYIWRKRIPHGILGPKDVRWLLVLRGFTGFFGIYGMWYSVKYIPLAEATVISFLAPNLAGYMCHILIHDSFTRREQLASFIALGGVVLITRPLSLFSGASPPQTAPSIIAAEAVFNATAEEVSYPGGGHIPTSAERLKAIGVALLGVLGASGAITSLRCIGKRAHPLVSVNYFGTWCVLVTTTILSVAPALDYAQPELRLELPDTIRQWGLLFVVGASGLIMQMLMTSGLAVEKSNRATAMMYTHMLFAAGFDRWVFGHRMGWMSLTGCGLIVGSALWAALTKREEKKSDNGDTEIGIVPIVVSGDNESVFTIDDETDTDEEGVMLRRM